MRRRLGTLLAVAFLSGLFPAARGLAGPTALGERIDDLEKRSSDVLAKVEAAEQEKARLEAEIEGLARRRKATRARLASRAHALYRFSRAGLLPLAGGVDAVLQHASRVERLERMVLTDVKALADLRTRGDALREETGRAAAEAARAQALLASLETEQRGLEQRRRAAEDALAAQGFESGTWQTPEGGIRVVDELPARRGFEAQRGELTSPVAGTFELREVTRPDGPALQFLSPPGTPVRAVAEGRVAFSDDYDGYGRLVILDHGDNYYTVYGGLGDLHAELGDYVGPGARLGRVGRMGNPPALVFEVRRGTRAVPPRPWLGL